MRRIVIGATLVLLAAGGGWLVLGGGAPPANDGARVGARLPVEAAVSDGPAARGQASVAVEPPLRPTERVASKRERDALRRRILEAMQDRERAAGRGDQAREGEGEHDGKTGEPLPERGEARRPDDEAPAPGNLVDRTGRHAHMVKVMNEDLMPLVDECYALARETQPQLAGMLVLDVEMIGDEDVGGVVDAVTMGIGNELADPGLLECVQESLLSTTLPPPPQAGRDALQISLRLEPDAD